MFCQILISAHKVKPQKKEDFYSYKPVLIETFVGIGNFRERLLSLAHLWIDNKEVKVLQKRLIKHEGEIFTFLEYPELEFSYFWIAKLLLQRKERNSVYLLKGSIM